MSKKDEKISRQVARILRLQAENERLKEALDGSEDVLEENRDLTAIRDRLKDQRDSLEEAALKVLEIHQPRSTVARDGRHRELRCQVCQTPEHHTWAPDNFEPWPCPTVAATGLKWKCYHSEDELLQIADHVRATRAEKVMGPVEDYKAEDDDLAVCISHLRFVPCRTDDHCQLSMHPDAVTAVRHHQQGFPS